MKFGKEFASQMVPEWEEAYLNYGQLKSVLKELQKFKKQRSGTNSPGHGPALKRKVTFYRAISGLTGRRQSSLRSPRWPAEELGEDQVILVQHDQAEGDGRCETRFLMTSEEGGEYEMVFFRRLDDEFNKVSGFYRGKMEEVLREADSLNKQMDALIAFRVRVEVDEDHHLHVLGAAKTPSPSSPHDSTGGIYPADASLYLSPFFFNNSSTLHN